MTGDRALLQTVCIRTPPTLEPEDGGAALNAWLKPRDLDEALRLLAASPLTVAAGCTDLYPATTRQYLTGDVLDISGLAPLRGVTRQDAGWRIGAATTWAEVLAADLPPGFDMLKAAAREVGSVQIQTTGTVGGNLCNASPAADGVPPLLALGASVELVSQAGSRVLPLGDFLAGPRKTARRADELVSAVLIPEAEGVSSFAKLGARKYLVISIAMVAARLVLDGERIARAFVAVGSCSPVARRLPALEARLEAFGVVDLPHGFLDGALSPIADVRGTGEYRQEAAETLVRRTLTGLMETAR